MAVAKQTYTLNPSVTSLGLRDLFKQAFIDAGLMNDWHDTFNTSNREYSVLRVNHGTSTTYGSSYYMFLWRLDYPSIVLYSLYNNSSHSPLGTQYIDYHLVPADVSDSYSNSRATQFLPGISDSTKVELHRYSSNDDPKQSWFVFQQGTTISEPFCFLRGDTVLYPWVDTTKGTVSGFSRCKFSVNNRVGYTVFTLEEQNRRTLLTGQSLHGVTDGGFHGLDYPVYRYAGVGRQNNAASSNLSGLLGKTNQGGVALPIGYSVSNPAYTSNYTPICSQLPWNPYTPAPLASDFGVYMHYAHNSMSFQDRFVVNAGVEEWEIIGFALNSVVDFGASPCFVARVV